jgi:membrane glycosyltransferase
MNPDHSDAPASPRARLAPPIERRPMRPTPWFGLMRGLLVALLPGLRYTWGGSNPTPWNLAARQRRRALFAVVIASGVMAAALLQASAPETPPPQWWLHATFAVLLLAWLGAGLATALMGAWVLWRGDRHGLQVDDAHAPISVAARTAVVMPICNEDIATVFAGLRATAESVAATGALALFDFFVLSDTSDAATQAAEVQALERLRTMLGDTTGARLFYRHRKVRRARKAGNVADFCRRWGAKYRYMVVLDADSAMRGDTLVQLVRLMEQHPNAGIVQTLPQAYGHPTLHARVQQFASRTTGRLFALGMAYWQLGEAHYWGHNAIIRVAPFMRHCALARIRGRGSLAGEILSHDFVEAAMMRRAGFEVWLAPQLEGSWEQLPPNLLDELQRDRRWCRGNLQNFRLIAEPGWRPAHRAMLAVGALSYVMAPLWLAFVALGALTGASTTSTLWGLTLTLLLTPRALGVAAVVLQREQAAYGGMRKLLTSALLELAVSAVQAPVRMLAHSAFVLGPLVGLRVDWKSPPRAAQTLRWRDAIGRIGVLAAPIVALMLLALPSGQWVSPYAVALLAPLLLAVPLAVLASHPGLGAALRRVRLLWVPDEQAPSRTLLRAVEQRGFIDLVPLASQPLQVPACAPQRSLAWRRGGVAFASVALCSAVAFTPSPATTPEWTTAMSVEAAMRTTLAALEEEDATSVAPPVETPLPAKRMRAVSQRPARMIDEAVRERARDAVRRSIEDGSDSFVGSV